MATGLDDFAELCVHALERVGRVDDAPNLRGKCEERNHACPGPAPGSDDRRKEVAPVATLERVQGTEGSVRTRRRVDRTQGDRQWLALFPIREVQTLPQEMRDARLQRGPREDGGEGFLHALETIGSDR